MAEVPSRALMIDALTNADVASAEELQGWSDWELEQRFYDYTEYRGQ